MVSTNKRSTTGGGDGENMPQGGCGRDGGYSMDGDGERPAMAKCHGDVMVLCGRDAGVVEGCCGSGGALSTEVKR